MGKRTRRRPRKPDPLAGKRHPPFGATEAQSERFAATRELKNRIHELEQHLTLERERARALAIELQDHKRDLVVRQPTTSQLAALRTVCAMPIDTAIEIGMLDVVHELARWLREIDRKSVAMSGANVLDRYAQASGKSGAE